MTGLKEEPSGDYGLGNVPTTKQLFESIYPNFQRYVFVFKQGFSRTNIHAVEFLYLLQMNSSYREPTKMMDLQSISLDDANILLNEYEISSKKTKNFSDELSIQEELKKKLCNKAIVDFYMTTAKVYIPDGVDIDFRGVMASSGFIHSYGNLIYFEDHQASNPIDLGFALKQALAMAEDEKKKSLIVPYCHEDFTARDREKSMFLEHGLDNIKLHITKTYIGQERLHEFLEDFVLSNKSDCCLAPSDYTESRAEFQKKFEGKEMSTVWIISDFSLREDELSPSNSRNLIVYRQILKNENIYHLYEENKPAWASHTTLPHSLAGAMLNLARRWISLENPIVCDPFSGSGTIYLEAQKFTGLRCAAFDLSPLNREVMSDNIRFFRLNYEELKEVQERLVLFRNAKGISMPLAKKKTESDEIADILGVVRGWQDTLKTEDFLHLDEQQIRGGLDKIGDDLARRVVLYCALRASVRGKVELERDTASWEVLFHREIDTLLKQIKNHVEELGVIGGVIQSDTVTVGRGSYSNQVMPPIPSGRSDDLFSLNEFDVADVKDLPNGVFDAVICDPPYGFNTEEDRMEIVKFANLLVERIVESLKPEGGQIIMALPRVSLSGREIPLSLRSDQIARAIIDYCLRTGRFCWRPSVVFPCPITRWINPPYYWRSEKALIRNIIHFWVFPHERVGQGRA